jgi:hypothetical protein
MHMRDGLSPSLSVHTQNPFLPGKTSVRVCRKGLRGVCACVCVLKSTYLVRGVFVRARRDQRLGDVGAAVARGPHERRGTVLQKKGRYRQQI